MRDMSARARGVRRAGGSRACPRRREAVRAPDRAGPKRLGVAVGARGASRAIRRAARLGRRPRHRDLLVRAVALPLLVPRLPNLPLTLSRVALVGSPARQPSRVPKLDQRGTNRTNLFMNQKESSGVRADYDPLGGHVTGRHSGEKKKRAPGTEVPGASRPDGIPIGGRGSTRLPEVGFEPTRSHLRGILSPLRLPVSPLRHWEMRSSAGAY